MNLCSQRSCYSDLNVSVSIVIFFIFSHQYPTRLFLKAVAAKSSQTLHAFLSSAMKRDVAYAGSHIKVRRAPSDPRWQLCGYYASETFHEKVFLSLCLTIDHVSISLFGVMQSTGPRNESQMILEYSLIDKVYLTRTADVANLLRSYFLAVHRSSSMSMAQQCTHFVHYTMKLHIWRQTCFESHRTVSPNGPACDVERAHINKHTVLPEWKADIPIKNMEGCDNVSILLMPEFHGSHKPTRASHIIALCSRLSLLHNAKKHYGDVLCQNVMLSMDTETANAVLIDYDYSHLPAYPDCLMSRAIGIMCMHTNSRQNQRSRGRSSP